MKFTLTLTILGVLATASAVSVDAGDGLFKRDCAAEGATCKTDTFEITCCAPNECRRVIKASGAFNANCLKPLPRPPKMA